MKKLKKKTTPVYPYTQRATRKSAILTLRERVTALLTKTMMEIFEQAIEVDQNLGMSQEPRPNNLARDSGNWSEGTPMPLYASAHLLACHDG